MTRARLLWAGLAAAAITAALVATPTIATLAGIVATGAD